VELTKTMQSPSKFKHNYSNKDLDMIIFSFIWKHTHTHTNITNQIKNKKSIAKTVLNNKTSATDITIPDFKFYYKNIIITAIDYDDDNNKVLA
jgi:hypothetical protein